MNEALFGFSRSLCSLLVILSDYNFAAKNTIKLFRSAYLPGMKVLKGAFWRGLVKMGGKGASIVACTSSCFK